MNFVYFTDRDLGKAFPDMLRSKGLIVERHDDHFPSNASDEAWLELVGERGWIALTHNLRIRYTPNERDAVMQHRVALLVIMGKAPLSELARSFVATLPGIERFLVGHKPPFIAKIYRPTPAEAARGATAGHVEAWYS